MRQHTLISVVDDDEAVRESLPELLAMLGFAARTFASATEFLAADAPRDTLCLILDVAMPEVSGPQLQIELQQCKLTVPIIFISGSYDADLRAKLLARGAIACLPKPFTEEQLRAALDAALGADRASAPT